MVKLFMGKVNVPSKSLHDNLKAAVLEAAQQYLSIND